MPQAETQKSRWRARKRPGAPRKPGEREAITGNLKRAPRAERQADILRTVFNQPHRRGIPMSKTGEDGPKGPGDTRAAYVFGRMRLRGELTKVQHDALQHWLETFVRYSRSLGLPQVHYGNCLAGSVGGGQHGEEGHDAAARAATAKRAFEALQDTMAAELGTHAGEVNAALVHCVMMDREPIGDMLGSLRVGANAIDRHIAGRRPG